MGNIKLNKKQEYKVQLYPGQVIVDTKYLDMLGYTHVFEHQGDNEKNYILVQDPWMEENEGLISHKCSSSVAINVVPEKSAFVVKGLTKLIKKSN